MTNAGLPVLPHQQAALARAVEILERAGSGLAGDAAEAAARDPQLADAAAAGREDDVIGFCRVVESAQRGREALDARGRTAIAAWTAFEQEYEAAGKTYEWDAQRAVGARMAAFAQDLKRDEPLDGVLRARGRSLGVAEGSRLDRVVQAAEIDAALMRSIDIEHGARARPGPSMGM
jgi:hypothetical protein